VSGEYFATFLLFAALVYSMTGIPTFDRDTTLDTDYVSPLNRWIWIGLLLAALPLLKQHGRAALCIARLSSPLLILFGYFALTTTWALDPAIAERRLLFSILQLLLLVILLAPLRQSQGVQLAVTAACLTVALGDVATWVVMPNYAMTDEGFAGFQTQKNQTGLMMMYGCLAAGTGCLLPTTFWRRAAWAGALFTMLAILALSRSTTSQVIVLVTPFLLVAVLLLTRLSDRLLLAVFTTSAALLALAVFVYFATCDVIGRDPLLPLRGITFTDRLDLWQFVVEEIKKRPWFGAGYSSFWAITPSVQPSLKKITWFSIYTIINEGHDGYLDLLATCGIFGFVGGVSVVLLSLHRAFRALQRSTQRSAPLFHMALLLALLIHNVTESNLFTNQGVLALALMLCVLDLNKWQGR
jgi:O-antigen ligase